MENLFDIVQPLPADELVGSLKKQDQALYDYLGREIYANADMAYLDEQRRRLLETLLFHVERVGNRPTVLLRAPGRLNAFLEYLDMCAGDHMSTTIDGDIPLAVSPREDGLLDVANINPLFPAERITLSAEFSRFAGQPLGVLGEGLTDDWDTRSRLLPYYGRPRGSWLNYVLAPWLRLMWQQRDILLHGVDMSFGRATVPFRAGISSSSAVVVLSFLSLAVANRHCLPPLQVNDVCALLGEAEWYVGTHGGANDQTTILCSQPNSVLYNRHSRPSLEATPLPFLQGVHVVLANSLWEVNKSLAGNQSFNMRKGWMEIGDRIMDLVLSTVEEATRGGRATGSGWVAKALQQRLGFDFVPHLPRLEADPGLWRNIINAYHKFGSLDAGILNVPEEALDELILTLPVKITAAEASRIFNQPVEVIESLYTRPRRVIGGYHTRTTARFFVKENRIGRHLERIFLEADDRLRRAELSPEMPEYDAYRVQVGRLVDHLQHALCYDFRVSIGQLDRLLDTARHGPGYLGGKLTGAGKGGCVSILVRESQSGAMCDYLDREYYGCPANFEEYRQILQDALRYFVDDDFERNSAAERLQNLERALADYRQQRRVVTFSRGACGLALPL